MGFKITKIVVDIVTILTIAFLIAMLCIVFSNVIMRYIFNAPIVGVTEVTRIIMVCLTCSVAGTLLRGQHVWIELLSQKFSRLGTIILDIITLAASCAIFAFMSGSIFTQMMKVFVMHKRYSILKIPEWPFYMIFGIAIAVFAFAIAAYLVDRLVIYSKGGTPVNAFSINAKSEKTIEEALAEEYDARSDRKEAKGGDAV